MKVNLGILTALWGRPELTELFLRRMSHLIDKFNITVMAVGSQGKELSALCESYKVNYVEHENKPLGKKWNHGLEAMRDFPVTHVMILGSDDFVSDSLIEYSINKIEDRGYDFYGSKGLYIYGAHPKRRGFGQFWYFKYGGYVGGPARCYSRRLLDNCDWNLWSYNKNYGLDGSAVKRIKMLKDRVAGSYDVETEGLFMVDIKSSGNISGIPGGAKPRGGFVNMLDTHLPKDESGGIVDFLKSIGAL